MSTYTNWYHLDKYEGQDKPNLLDQYNAAMDKIDSQLKTLANEIAGGGGGGVIPPDLESRLEELETDVSNLQSSTYNPYSQTNIVFIGDSYTYGTGASDHGQGDTKRFSSLICAYLGANEFNFGVGSTGFCDPGSSGQNAPFKSQVLTARNSMTAEERSNTSAVIIAGGLNDAHDATAFTYTQMMQGCIDCVNNAREAFPNAKILVVPMLWKGYNFSNRAEDYYNAIIAGVKETGAGVYMQGCYTWNWGDSTHFNSDKLHPTDLGHEVIAKNIYAGLKNEQLIIWEDHVYDITYASSGKFEAGENSDNKIILREGIVYIPSLRVRALDSIASNTAFGSCPRSMTPRTNAYAQINHANQIYGTYTVTASHTFWCNPHLTALNTNDEFYCTPLAFKVYGEDYNQ